MGVLSDETNTELLEIIDLPIRGRLGLRDADRFQVDLVHWM